MTQMYLVPPHQVDEVWGAVAPLVEKARERVGHDVDTGDFYTACRTGQMYLFVSEDVQTVAMGRFQEWRRKPTFRVQCLASSAHRDWSAVLEQAKKFGQENGAKFVLFEGREGWARKIPGAKRVRSTYEVSIDGR